MLSTVTEKYIINYMKPNQVKPHSIDTSKDLLLSARGASTTYRIYPEEES